jgi:hypothetical protein
MLEAVGGSELLCAQLRKEYDVAFKHTYLAVTFDSIPRIIRVLRQCVHSLQIRLPRRTP